jgi:hypothetical protein
LVVAWQQMADYGAALDLLAAGDHRVNRFVGCTQAADVFQGDQRPVDHHAREHHEPVTGGEHGLAGKTAKVDSAMTGTVGRSGRDEGADHDVRRERPRET